MEADGLKIKFSSFVTLRKLHGGGWIKNQIFKFRDVYTRWGTGGQKIKQSRKVVPHPSYTRWGTGGQKIKQWF